MSAATSPTPADSHAPGAPEPSRASRNLPVLRVWILLGIFLLGIGASWIAKTLLHEPAPADIPPVPEIATKPEPMGTPAEILARGDKALGQHRIAEALAEYDELRKASTPGVPLDYRLGLCHESLGQLDKAIARYRATLTASPTASLELAAHLGMARCLLRQKEASAARRLLLPSLLDQSRHRSSPELLAGHARLLVALSFAHDAQPTVPAVNKKPTLLLVDEFLSATSIPLDVPLFLDEITTRPAAAKNVEVPKEPIDLEKLPNGYVHVKGIATAGPAQPILDAISDRAGWKAEWTADAKKAAGDRTLTLNLSDWPLLEAIDFATESLGLVAHLEKDAIRFMLEREVEAKALKAHQNELARRALHAMVRIESPAPSAAVQLELGNTAATQGKWSEALGWYDRAARAGTSTPIAIAARHNAAQVYLRKHEWADARRALFRVIDQGPRHELALRAWLRLGQLALESGEAREAIVPLRQAQRVAVESPYHPVATLTLAAAHLEQGDGELARATLAKHRAVLHKEPYRVTAAFLDTYAQFRAARKAGDYRRETADLVSTLCHDQEESLLGPFGLWLMAEAYRDLGFFEQAEKLLRKTAKDLHGPFTSCLDYSLADTLAQRGDHAEAARLFEEVTARDTPYRAKARFELARLDLLHKRYHECAAKCQQLWKDKAFADAQPLLRVWGAALEGSGDITRAAQCYAGKAPD